MDDPRNVVFQLIEKASALLESQREDKIEDNLLGAMIVDPTSIPLVAARVRGSDFYFRPYGEVFELLVMCYESKRPVSDAALLIRGLKKHDLLEVIGGTPTVMRWFRDSVSSHAIFYSEEIVKASQARAFVSFFTKSLGEVLQPKAAIEDVLQRAAGRIDLVSSRSSVDLTTLAAAATQAMARHRTSSERGKASSIPTGLAGIDRVMGGLFGGELIVVAARPGEGKTAIAQQIALDASIAGKSVLFVTLEMTAEELATRALCNLSGVNGQLVRTGAVNEHELRLMEAAKNEYMVDSRFQIYAPGKATVRQITAAAKLAGGASKVELLVVDYINIVTPSDWKRQRHEQVGQITRDLKQLAQELSIPVIALSQLSRSADGEKPKLSHLKESSSVEQDADVVLALHTVNSKFIDVIFLKNRHGPRCTVALKWEAELTRFADHEPPEPE